MIHLLLASWLSTQHWEWDKLPADQQVTAYRIYWGASGTAWCTANMVELDTASHCGLAAGCDSDAQCCGEIPMPDFSPAFIVVTGVNVKGESDTEHGPILVCP